MDNKTIEGKLGHNGKRERLIRSVPPTLHTGPSAASYHMISVSCLWRCFSRFGHRFIILAVVLLDTRLLLLLLLLYGSKQSQEPELPAILQHPTRLP